MSGHRWPTARRTLSWVPRPGALHRACPFHRPGNGSSERSRLLPKIVQAFLISTLRVVLRRHLMPARDLCHCHAFPASPQFPVAFSFHKGGFEACSPSPRAFKFLGGETRP